MRLILDVTKSNFLVSDKVNEILSQRLTGYLSFQSPVQGQFSVVTSNTKELSAIDSAIFTLGAPVFRFPQFAGSPSAGFSSVTW